MNSMSFKGTICKNNSTLMIYIPRSANTLGLERGNEVLVQIIKM